MDTLYFPMFVDISRMQIVVAGGGQIAARRIQTLLRFAQNITVIAPEITESLEVLVQSGRVQYHRREYQTGDISRADIVLAATNQHELNRQIAGECRKYERETGRRILVSVADDRSLCDFYFPAVVEKEGVVIGINSSGKNPGNVKTLRKKVESVLESK